MESRHWLLNRRELLHAGAVHAQADTVPPRHDNAVFEQVVGYLADRHVDGLPRAALYEMAIAGLLERLNDPYTSFLSAVGSSQVIGGG